MSRLGLILLAIIVTACKGGGGGTSSGTGTRASDDNNTTTSFSMSQHTFVYNSNAIVTSIYPASNNDLFIGASDANNSETGIGLYKSSNKGSSFSKLDSSNGLLFDSINHIAEGPGGIIYVTHYYMNYNTSVLGYSKSTDSSGESFTTVTTPLNAKDKKYIALDSSGHIFTSGNRTERSVNSGTSFSYVGSIGTDNRVWVGKTTNNIYMYNSSASGLQISTDNGNNFSSVGLAQGLAGSVIMDVKEDSAGNIYVASLRSSSTNPGGLAVSSDGGTSFIQRLLPLNSTGTRSIYDMSINSDNVLCVATEAGFSCSKDSGYTWYSHDLSFHGNKIGVANNGVIAVADTVSFAVNVSNGILPTGMGTSFSNGTLPSIIKLSNLPVGTYTRRSTKVHTFATSGSNKSVMVATAGTSTNQLVSSHIDAADTLSSTLHTVASFRKNANGSIDSIDDILISSSMGTGNVFTGSVSLNSSGTTNTSAATIASDESTAKDPVDFTEYRWLSTNVLRRTIYLESGTAINPSWMIFEDFDYAP